MPTVKEWLAELAAERAKLDKRRIAELFADDDRRAHTLSRRLGTLHVDFSKEKIDQATITALLHLAEAAGVSEHREAMFAGRPINNTEKRPALHVALRMPADRKLIVPGQDVIGDVRRELKRMLAFAAKARDEAHSPFRHIVNLGIGGSDLGPALAAGALKPYGAKHLTCHYVSNVDGAHLGETLAGLDPAETLFIIVSKTFTTAETMANAVAARQWLAHYLGTSAVKRHFCAVSTNSEAVEQFGIDEEHRFGFWDWVGGRYSLWSSVGLSLAILIGPDQFKDMLTGAHAMDEHFLNATPQENIPLLLGLLGVYRRLVCGQAARAIIPYDQRLARLPAYLQQLDMESNGKSVRRDGSAVDGPTGPAVWGEAGTNSQHAFFQWLHQGTDIVPVEFLVAAEPTHADPDQHDMLLANCFAQSQALMQGRGLAEVEAALAAKGLGAEAIKALAPHRVFAGDRPSTTLLYKRLDPHTFGMLLALYEHRVFVEGIVYGINSFDQWGVELGKERATALLPAIRGEAPPKEADPSTLALLAAVGGLRKAK